jgi:hypothetical protein
MIHYYDYCHCSNAVLSYTRDESYELCEICVPPIYYDYQPQVCLQDSTHCCRSESDCQNVMSNYNTN